MAWVRMTQTHTRIWGPAGPHDRRVRTRYKDGAAYRVKREVADELVAAGVAVETKPKPSANAVRPPAPPAKAADAGE